MPTAEQLIREGARALKASDAVDHPHLGKEQSDAEDILAHVLGRAAPSGEEVPGPAVRSFHRLLARRVGGEPLAYVIGSTDFLGLQLEVRPGVFIPRQSSEFMAVQAIRRLRGRPGPVHVDVATGIGPVALAVASALPGARVIGLDISRPPLELARRNARRLRLSNVRFLHGDLFSPLPGGLARAVDVVTIHPPYVGRREIRTLPDEIVKFEPEESLTDFSPRGDRILRRVAAEAPAWLRPGGWLLVEVSPDRSREVSTILRRARFGQVRSTKGPVPVSRVVVGRA